MSAAKTTPAFFVSGNHAVNLAHVAQAHRGFADYVVWDNVRPLAKTWFIMARGTEKEISFSGREALRAWKAIEAYRATTRTPVSRKAAS